MRTIQALYRLAGTSLTEMSLSTVSPKDLILYQSDKDNQLNVKYMAKVKDLEQDSDVFVDILSMFTMTELISDCLSALGIEVITSELDFDGITWELVGEHMTDKMVMAYTRVIPSFEDGTRSLRYAQVLHTSEFEFSYGLLQTPEDRNNKYRRWQLVDAIISKTNSENTFDLSQCLLSVNGCISLPHYFNEELISPLGAKFTHGSSWEKQPSIDLLDFTNLGGITCVPFSSCTYRVRTGRTMNQYTTNNQAIQYGQDIQITLPDDISVKGKTVWMVLAHSLYFEEHVSLLNERDIVISPHMLSLGTMLSKVKYHLNEFNRDTDVISTEAIEDYISSTAWQKDHYGAFFVLIGSDRLFRKEEHLLRYAKDRMHIGAQGISGLAWDACTHSAFDSTICNYNTITHVYCKPSDDLAIPTEYDPQGSYTATDRLHPHFRRMMEVKDPDMLLLNVIRA